MCGCAEFVQAAWRGHVSRRDVLGEFRVAALTCTNLPSTLMHKPSPFVRIELEDDDEHVCVLHVRWPRRLACVW